MARNRKTKKLSDEEQMEFDKIVSHQLENHHNSEQKNSIQSILKQIHIDIKCKSENQKKLVNSIKEKEITICEGPPGSGKTFLSCAEALLLLKNNYPTYKQIILLKSVTTLDGESLGYLKGDINSKLDPIMYSYTGNFEKLIGHNLYSKLLENNLIKELPLGYIRGLTFSESIVILDETQNVSLENIRTFLTRIGTSKYILLGDKKQIDIKNKKISSLDKIMNKFEKFSDFGVIRLGKEDIVRHRLISMIEDIFDEIESENLIKIPKK